MQPGPFLKLSQRQQLALTPQLQQSIRLLQLSAQDLEAEIAQAIQDNPMLEQQEQYDIDAASGEHPTTEEEPRYWSVSDFSNHSGRARDANDDPGMPEKRSEEHTSELQSLMRRSYAVFCLKTKRAANDAYKL